MAQQPWQHLVAAGYDQVADAYVALERAESQWPREQWLGELSGRLPAGSRVLDLGCGDGLPACAALAKDHSVIGADVSSEQVARARRNVPGAEFVVADLTELRYPTGEFDAVTAYYTFDHLPREALGELFTRIAGWLRPGGLLLFCVETEDQPGTVEQWLGAPMFFSSYRPAITRRLVVESGFEILREDLQPQQEGDTTVEYLWILARAGD
ncbi:methyltransferase domain-containing protein [Natronosporangium hydrolyticum]|uniref:Methyltransferase domain-containing protein n=1 Tax=Natronosporangium hydrolyticum TaxID=2811111 RepID=A0A895YL77_9ACTN|nr:class I SAM-dependent methyltransferase [Natronosporangium hydrolyticum]QSB16249.1 methyltransferase domain-containing protein [Natronosporangium hydrolyticum]